MSNNTLELIAKLLAKAEGSTTDQERDTYNEKAQQIAAANSIDVAKARHLKQSKESIVIGVPGTEGLKTLVNLYLGIAKANDLECLMAHNSTRVYAIGFEEDIDVTDAMYASLITQMTTAVAAFKKDGSWREEEVWAEGWYSTRRQMYIRGRMKRINWRGARLNFQDAFAKRISNRLYEVQCETRRRRIAEEMLTPEAQSTGVAFSGTALVLASKREAVTEAYNKAPKSRASWSGSVNGQSSSSARQAGRTAADRASLGSSTSLSGARKGIES
jgi:hypothetical protein